MNTTDTDRMLYPIGETDSQSRRLITQAQLQPVHSRLFSSGRYQQWDEGARIR